MLFDQKILTFLKVYECCGITRAAHALNLTQPAVTNQIKELESELKVRLFEKHGRGLAPTDRASLLYRRCLVMKNDADRLYADLKDFNSSVKTYNFGATMTVGEYVIPQPLARMLKANPSVRANLEIGNTDMLIGGLKRGDIDFALIEGSVSPENLEIRRFASVPFIGVCNKEHLFAKEHLQLSDLLDECLVCREHGSGTRNILESRLMQDNLKIGSFKETIIVRGMHAILLMLKEDLGISFMYEPAAQEFIEEGILKQIEIENFSIKHDFSFVWLKNSIYSSQYDEFFRTLLGFYSMCNKS